MDNNFFFKELDGVSEWGKFTHMAESPDGTYILPFNDSVVSHHLRLYGSYEKPYLEIILAFMTEMELNNHPHTVMFDIGANVGAWTLGMSGHVGPLGKVYSFEVQRDVIMHLSATLVYNGVSNVYPIHGAVTNVSGFTDMFHLTSGQIVNYGAFSIQGHANQREQAEVHYRIPNIVLDDYFYNEQDESFECPSFIKMDVELHEMYVLLGGGQLLRHCRPVLFMEANCGRLVDSMVLLVDSYGYDIAWVIAPLVHPAADHFGRKMHTPAYEHTSDFYRDQMFGGPNMIAVPRGKGFNRSGRTPMEHLVDMFPANVRQIDVASGEYNLERYELGYCVSAGLCDNARMPANSCGKVPIDPFIEHYWQRLKPKRTKAKVAGNTKKSKKSGEKPKKSRKSKAKARKVKK
jgi:FkbM family methyltransferase